MPQFVDVKYQTDQGPVMLTRMSEDEAVIAGAEPTAAVDLPAHVLNSGSRRKFGVHPRGVLLRNTIDTGVCKVTKTKFVAVLTPAVLLGEGYSTNSTFDIGGVTWEIAKVIKESYA